MAQLIEYIKMALANIKANKGRSVLTMLGIIIGISSVITIMAVGDGFKNEMASQFDAMLGGQLAFYTGEEADANNDQMTGDDLDAIEQIEGVTGTSPFFNGSGKVVLPKGEFKLSLSGGGTAEEEVQSVRTISGRFYDKGDIDAANKVCVIKKESAMKAFGTDDVIGMDVEVTLNASTVNMTIIGVCDDKSDGGLVGGGAGYTGDNVYFYIPYTTFENFGYVTDSFYGTYVTTDGVVPTDKISNEVLHLLNRRHNVTTEDYFLMEDANAQISQIDSMMGMITGFISLVAAISLLVGGIGVMNIMLVSVTERTREIGIRKSLGAKTGSIMLQFLAESAIIAGMGGVIGIILGVLLAQGICSLPMLGFQAGIKVSTVLIATLFSSGIGVFFGIYPARKAAKLSPIEALRRD